ncbi:MAG: RluA family pseudouridine synthase [Velocimicrobium sp.]
MKIEDMKLLFEDADILVCEKPAGVPSQSDKTGDYDMVNKLKNYLFEKEPKNGEPYIGLVHRLDRPVGGVMVFAKTPLAARRLSESIRSKDMIKRYLAVLNFDAGNECAKEPKRLCDYLIKDARMNCSHITNAKDKNAKKAELFYQIREVRNGLSLAEIELLTGRHHQIRVQMAENLGGVWGDTKYNSLFKEKKGFYRMGLYAYELSFTHPVKKKKMCFTSYPSGEPFDFFHLKEIN